MTRNIILSNGELTVGLNGFGLVQELFYPDVSAGNHVGNRSIHHKIGVYCEGAIHWLDDGTWQIRQDYLPGQLISKTTATSSWLSLRLNIQDYVDSEINVLVRNIHVVNLSKRQRLIKLFMHQTFNINDNSASLDTAQYLPAGGLKGLSQQLIVHYHSDKTFAIFGESCDDNHGFTEYSIGHYGKYDGVYMNGVWCDAADGILAQNPVEQGNTDSIIDFTLSLAPHDSSYINYYLLASDSLTSAGKAAGKVLREGYDIRIKKTTEYWSNWLRPATTALSAGLSQSDQLDVLSTIISSAPSIGDNGAVVSSYLAGNSPQPVVRPITSALTALALHRLGLDIEVGRIYDFFADPLATTGYILPTYLTGGQAGPNQLAWLDDGGMAIKPIRLSDNATLLYALARSILLSIENGKQTPQEWKKRWQKIGRVLADFLCDNIDPASKLPRPTYQLWSDRPSTSSSDVIATYEALRLASQVADKLRDVDSAIKYRVVIDDISANVDELWNKRTGYFYAGIKRSGSSVTYDESITSDSFLWATISDLFDSETVEAAHQTLVDLHLANNGTYVRYIDDNERDGYSLEQIMALSLLIGHLRGEDTSGLIAACQKVLTSGGYRKSKYALMANNNILLRATYLLVHSTPRHAKERLV